MIPYARQSIDDDDVHAVSAVLRSDWLTSGPVGPKFETAVAEYCGVRHAVALSSGTAALHAAMNAIGVGPGDEVVVPTMTFVATANAVIYQGGIPRFVDVSPDTLLIDVEQVESVITPRTRAIVAVDYAGQPCDYPNLRQLASQRGIRLIADSCHALGATLDGQKVGSLADLTVLSFHPVKHIATGEGGMVVTDHSQLAETMRRFRNHGISKDFREREAAGSWEYEMASLGYNYRLSDIQAALGLSQLAKLPGWLTRRRAIASRYGQAIEDMPAVQPIRVKHGVAHAYHLYPVLLDRECHRRSIFSGLRSLGVGTNVHYLPAHMHKFYRERFGTRRGMFIHSEDAYDRLLSLPMFVGLTDRQVDRVIEALDECLPSL